MELGKGNAHKAIVNQSQQAEPQERQPQVAEQIEILAVAINHLAECIAHLQIRLQPVLSLAPKEGTEGQKGNEPTCPVAAAIATLADQVVCQQDAVSDLLRRLEV